MSAPVDASNSTALPDSQKERFSQFVQEKLPRFQGENDHEQPHKNNPRRPLDALLCFVESQALKKRLKRPI